MKRNVLSIWLLATITLLLSSCNKWEDPEFQAPTYNGPQANRTIADIKAMHTLSSGNLDSICSYDETFIVKAVVVSSDQGGNCYKYLTIQDETGGIEIAIDRSGLYNEYPVGQTVYLDCRGLIVGDYHKKYQIGWKYNGSVGRIQTEALKNYLHKDGLPDPDHPYLSKPVEVTGASQLSLENVNCFVKMNGVRFADDCDGMPFASNDFTTDRDATINGQSFIVRTSNYANFRSDLIDADAEYCLYGILSVYNSEYQLTLRTRDDIQFAQHEEDVILKTFTFNGQSLTDGGWRSWPEGGWRYQAFQGNQFLVHLGTNEACDDWLVSPEINIADLSDAVLVIDHANNVAGSPAIYYQAYYSTTYSGGAVNESDWHAFSPNINTFPSSFGNSNELSLSSVGSSTFRIALRYRKSGNADGTRWMVRSMSIYQKSQK